MTLRLSLSLHLLSLTATGSPSSLSPIPRFSISHRTDRSCCPFLGFSIREQEERVTAAAAGRNQCKTMRAGCERNGICVHSDTQLSACENKNMHFPWTKGWLHMSHTTDLLLFLMETGKFVRGVCVSSSTVVGRKRKQYHEMLILLCSQLTFNSDPKD